MFAKRRFYLPDTTETRRPCPADLTVATGIPQTPAATDKESSDMLNGMSRYQPQALGLLRVVTALLFIEHGTQKLFGFPAPGMESLNTLMLVAGILEAFGGLLVLVGFLTRPVAFILSGMMAVAYWMAHAPQNFFPVNNSGDAAILFCFVFLYLFFAGPGAFSVDNRNNG